MGIIDSIERATGACGCRAHCYTRARGQTLDMRPVVETQRTSLGEGPLVLHQQVHLGGRLPSGSELPEVS